MSKIKTPTEVFSDSLKFQGLVHPHRKPAMFSFECAEKKKVYMMRVRDFSSVAAKMKDGILEGTWVTGVNSYSEVIRPYNPSTSYKKPLTVKFSSNQIVKYARSKRWACKPDKEIPARPFEVILTFAGLLRGASAIYALYRMSRLDSSLIFGVDDPQLLYMKQRDFEELIVKSGYKGISQVNAIWNWKSAGRVTSIYCEKLL